MPQKSSRKPWLLLFRGFLILIIILEGVPGHLVV